MGANTVIVDLFSPKQKSDSFSNGEWKYDLALAESNLLICLMLSVQESLARKRIQNGSKAQLILGDRIKPLFIL